MKIIDLKRVNDFEVKKWIEESIPNLTPYQKEVIRAREIVRFAPFYFMARGKQTSNVFLRLTIIFILPVLIILIIGLPFRFFITGRWGYNSENLKWYTKWVSSCGL